MIIDGKKIAEEILKKLETKTPPLKYLAVFLVGENENSLSFVKQKEKTAKRLNIDFRVYKYPENITGDYLRKEIHKIGDKKRCGGVIVQLPLPSHINSQYVLNAIQREKDIDVLGERALGAFYTERNIINPPAVETLKEILSQINFDLSSARAAVVGNGKLVGRPIQLWLSGKVKELYVLGRNSDFSLLKNSDLVVLGTGKPHLISPSVLKPNAVVIDFGYEKRGSEVCGDFCPDEEKINELNITYTPTPGGTGPVLVTKVLENFYRLNSIL